MRLVEERMEVGDAIAPVAAFVDAQAAQTPLFGPRPNGVRMDAEQTRGPGDGEDRRLVARFDERVLPVGIGKNWNVPEPMCASQRLPWE
jgi:hypothetical protein